MNMKPNFNEIMQQAQKMQARMQSAQERLEGTEVEGTAGAAPLLVTVTKRGNRFTKLSISTELLKEEKEIIEDLVLAAFNNAVDKFESVSQKMMKDITASIEIPEDLK